MVDMDARYLYAIAVGLIAGILLNIAHVVAIAINIISLFVVPVLPVGLGLAEAVVLLVFLAGTGAFTAWLVRERYGANGTKAAAVAGLVMGIVGQIVSLLISLLVAIVIAAIGAASGYYFVGGDHPWLSAAALGIGGLVLASLYSVVQYVVLAFVFMIVAALGGFLYNHMVELEAKKRGFTGL